MLTRRSFAASAVFASSVALLWLAAEAVPSLAQGVCGPCTGNPETVTSHNWTVTFVRPTALAPLM